MRSSFALLVVFGAPSARRMRGLVRMIARRRAWGGFGQLLVVGTSFAVLPSAMADGKVEFLECREIVHEGVLREYYEGGRIFGEFLGIGGVGRCHCERSAAISFPEEAGSGAGIATAYGLAMTRG